MKRQFLSLLLGLSLGLSALPLSASAKGENLAAGRPYTVTSDFPNGHSYSELDADDGKKLTDGAKGKSSWTESAWAKFYRAGGRTVTIDLGSLCEIDEICAGFVGDNSAGVYLPEEVTVFVSEDGEHFSKAEIKGGNTAPFGQNEKRPCTVERYQMPVEPICGRYVAVHFDVLVNTFIDEIEVFGSKETSLMPPTEYTEILPPSKGQFVSRDALGGDHDLILFHAGYYPEDESLVNNTEATILPFAAYVDRNGKILDSMFDAFIFTPIQGRSPSGGSLIIVEGDTVLSDWEFVLDSYFSDQYNLHVLNEVAGKVGEATGNPDYRISVYLTCPYPKTGSKPFGDYNGDGRIETLSTYEDCLAVSEWFVDECVRRFAENGYEHLSFKGFFNNSEGLTGTRYPYERQYAKDFCDLIHGRGLYCVMIPYYQGKGSEDPEAYGFDAALMQPNLSFNETLQDDPAGMMDDFAAACERFGLGIEMEINTTVIWNVDDKSSYYLDYLRAAIRSGMMTDTIHAYYNGAGAGVFGRAAFSDVPRMRWLYDLTYKFIKGTLALPEPIINVEEEPRLTVQSGGKETLSLGIPEDWCVAIKVKQQPAHGIVTLDKTGKEIVFKADRKYVGEDSFTFDVYLFDQLLAERTVTVNITEENVPGNISEAPSGEQTEPVSEAGPSEKQGFPWGIVAGVFAAVAAAACAVVASRKKKN